MLILINYFTEKNKSNANSNCRVSTNANYNQLVTKFTITHHWYRIIDAEFIFAITLVNGSPSNT